MKMSREGTLNCQRLFTDFGFPGHSDALYFRHFLTGVKVLASSWSPSASAFREDELQDKSSEFFHSVGILLLGSSFLFPPLKFLVPFIVSRPVLQFTISSASPMLYFSSVGS